jgi:phage pi2 protein 07
MGVPYGIKYEQLDNLEVKEEIDSFLKSIYNGKMPKVATRITLKASIKEIAFLISTSEELEILTKVFDNIAVSDYKRRLESSTTDKPLCFYLLRDNSFQRLSYESGGLGFYLDPKNNKHKALSKRAILIKASIFSYVDISSIFKI